MPVDRAAWTALVWDLDGTLTVPGTATPAAGVGVVLAAWAARGTPMALASTATTPVARAVLAGLGFDGWFTHVAGTGPGVGGKDEVIAEALLGLGLPLPAGADGAVMVGDAPGDVHAARALGFVAIGVGWGAAPPAVLRAAGADEVVDDPAALAPP